MASEVRASDTRRSFGAQIAQAWRVLSKPWRLRREEMRRQREDEEAAWCADLDLETEGWLTEAIREEVRRQLALDSQPLHTDGRSRERGAK